MTVFTSGTLLPGTCLRLQQYPYTDENCDRCDKILNLLNFKYQTKKSQ